MEDLLNQILSDGATKIAEETIASTIEPSIEDSAWEVADIMLDTGAGEALALFFGAPAVVLIALRGFKSYRKRKRGTSN